MNRNNLIFIADNSNQETLILRKGNDEWHVDNILSAPVNTYINNVNVYPLNSDGSFFPVTSHDRLIDLLRDSFDFHPEESGINGSKKDVANRIRNDTHARRYRCLGG
ncbi:hypothetical protein R0L47_16815 [Pectobacterium polonicum]|uniref:hypothetical protein n=1 Tax=Pectobacterium polonicum TaxID=2485124 RepID=UPI0010F90EA5|nr:hypothetical protein [Pectobacterium polonicum]TKY81240.1 hypothetical protein EDI29_16820 [Pectobacterium polonicum]